MECGSVFEDIGDTDNDSADDDQGEICGRTAAAPDLPKGTQDTENTAADNAKHNDQNSHPKQSPAVVQRKRRFMKVDIAKNSAKLKKHPPNHQMPQDPHEISDKNRAYPAKPLPVFARLTAKRSDAWLLIHIPIAAAPTTNIPYPQNKILINLPIVSH